MANRNWASGGKVYSMHVSPVLLDCNFVVDSTNGNGLGIRSLKGPCISAVYMHTSATPAPGNPNPAAGNILIQFADNYNRNLSGFDAKVSPLSGSPLTSVSSGVAYVIVSLGTTTPADWQSLGFPAGFSPAVGAAFIANTSASIPHSGAVEVPATAGSNITDIETVGDPNLTIANSMQPSLGGAQLILRCMKNAVQTAPADGTVISLAFLLNNSSITVQGE
jgi:hypothetical protein